jgi:NitT/TauT family transport system substrate-binding protein
MGRCYRIVGCQLGARLGGARSRGAGSAMLGLLLFAACAPGAAPAPAAPAVSAPAASPSAAGAANAGAAAAAAPAGTANASAPAAPAAAATAAPAPYTVRWAAISANPNNFPAYTAQAKGFLAEQALDLDVTYTDSSPRATQVLASRDIDVAAVATDTTIEAVERGAPFVMIGGSTRVPVYALATRPEVRTYADLRGKLVAVTGPNLAEQPFLRKLLAKNGLGESDYEQIAVGGPVQRFAAVQSGAVAAGMLNQPLDFRAVDEGLNLLGYSTEVLPDYQFIGYTSHRTWTSENRDVVVRLLRALRKADRWLYDPANGADAARVFQEATNSPESYARRTWELLYRDLKVMGQDSTVSLTGLQAVIDLMVDGGSFTGPPPLPAKYYDSAFVEEAARTESAAR